jgi:predicted dinucleotide-binding enzyme
MRIAVLGTGVVGRALAGKLAERGHDVSVGTRDVDALMRRTEGGLAGAPFSFWIAGYPDVRVAPFREAATSAELVVNATEGTASLEALRAAGSQSLAGKILIDVSNPLDFSAGFPPRLSVSNDDSLGEQVQRAFPEARVVKTLNTVTAMVMVDPGLAGRGEHHMFVCGDDEAAKAEVTRMLVEWLGWKHVIDLGDITAARGMEMYLPLWVRMFGKLGPIFNVRIVTAEG